MKNQFLPEKQQQAEGTGLFTVHIIWVPQQTGGKRKSADQVSQPPKINSAQS